MNYYSTQERKSKIFAGAAVVIYFIFGIALMLFVSFSFDRPVIEEGIMMDLSGEVGQPSSLAAQSLPQEKAQSKVTPDEEEMLTQEHEEAPEVVKPKPKPKPVPKKEPEKPVEKPREVNKNALFKPRADASKEGGSAATSQDGSSGKGGYSGDENGTGGGGVDSQYSVGNRRVVGSLPLPSTNYGKNKSGKVVIEVYVDANGYVSRAPVYKAQGSTTNDNELVKVAIDAAKKARFTTAENDVPQVGTITYTFKLK